jgi:hypothetical protein
VKNVLDDPALRISHVFLVRARVVSFLGISSSHFGVIIVASINAILLPNFSSLL